MDHCQGAAKILRLFFEIFLCVFILIPGMEFKFHTKEAMHRKRMLPPEDGDVLLLTS